MWHDSAAFGLNVRDVIGAWLVCLAVAAAFFGCPLVSAEWSASLVQSHAVASRPSLTTPAELCAWKGLSVAVPRG